MRQFFLALPVIIIVPALILLYWFSPQLPPSLSQALPWLPYLLLAVVVLLASLFNLSQLFYLSLICTFNAYYLQPVNAVVPWANDIVMISSLLAILCLTWLPEKGLFNLAAWPTHLLMLALLALPIGLLARDSHWVTDWLMFEWLPMDWLSWSVFAANTWLLLCLGLVILLVKFLRFYDRTAFNGLWISLVVVWMHHWPAPSLALQLAASAGLMLLLVSALQQSWQLAYVDQLTGLPGRRALEERLQRALGIYALAMVDVDHFKKFNDQYGHDVGDDVLRMIAAKIGAVGGNGKAYRYGGEEFTVLFNNHSADEIKFHLLALIEAVANTPFVVNRRNNQKPKTTQVTISIGLTDSINHSDAQSTIKTADLALYQAKKKGRNRLATKMQS